jgi:hypothetical protein
MLQAVMSANNISYAAVVDIIRLMNLVIGEKKLPESVYMFKRVCANSMKFEKMYFCKKCTKDFGKDPADTKRCDVCLTESLDYFIYTPIARNLDHILSKNMDDVQRYRVDLANMDPNIISDVNNADWRRGLNNGENILTVNINTDGVSPFNSTKKASLWPLLLTVNDLPPSIRFLKKNVITAGYWMSEIQPVMEVFLRPFINDLNQLYDNGIVVNGVIYKVIVCACCLDSVARAKLLVMKQFNGSYGCSFCYHTADGQKYTTSGHVELRILERYLEDLTAFECLSNDQQQKKDIKGVKGRTSLLRIRGFNPMLQVPVDFMHCCLLGVTKKLIDLWTNKSYKNCAFYISEKNQKTIDDRFKKLKTFSECKRKSSSIFKHKGLKANELFNFLFYYAKPCLQGSVMKPE